jgi:RecA/RadA recombinase
MRLLADLNSNPERIKQLTTEGWLTEQFLSLLSVTELYQLLNSNQVPPDSSITIPTGDFQKIQGVQQKIRTKQGISPETIPNLQIPWTISTGITQLDAILDGNGITPGSLTLFYGAFRTGKSQIIHQCCVNSYQTFKENLSPKIALFIDTEGTFRPERITQMASALQFNPADVLQRISVIHVNSLSELTLLLPKLEEIVVNQRIKLLAIDSLNNLHREELSKAGQESFKIIQLMVKLLSKIHEWAENYKFAAIMTGQVTTAFTKSYFFDVIPVLSTTLNFLIKEWVLLAENEEVTAYSENAGRRFAHLINNQTKKEAIIQFLISDMGVRDYY